MRVPQAGLIHAQHRRGREHRAVVRGGNPEECNGVSAGLHSPSVTGAEDGDAGASSSPPAPSRRRRRRGRSVSEQRPRDASRGQCAVPVPGRGAFGLGAAVECHTGALSRPIVCPGDRREVAVGLHLCRRNLTAISDIPETTLRSARNR